MAAPKASGGWERKIWGVWDELVTSTSSAPSWNLISKNCPIQSGELLLLPWRFHWLFHPHVLLCSILCFLPTGINRTYHYCFRNDAVAQTLQPFFPAGPPKWNRVREKKVAPAQPTTLTFHSLFTANKWDFLVYKWAPKPRSPKAQNTPHALGKPAQHAAPCHLQPRTASRTQNWCLRSPTWLYLHHGPSRGSPQKVLMQTMWDKRTPVPADTSSPWHKLIQQSALICMAVATAEFWGTATQLWGCAPFTPSAKLQLPRSHTLSLRRWRCLGIISLHQRFSTCHLQTTLVSSTKGNCKKTAFSYRQHPAPLETFRDSNPAWKSTAWWSKILKSPSQWSQHCEEDSIYWRIKDGGYSSNLTH